MSNAISQQELDGKTGEVMSKAQLLGDGVALVVELDPACRPGDRAEPSGSKLRRVRLPWRDHLEGKSTDVAAGIRRRATTAGLAKAKRKKADDCARYLVSKAAYVDYPAALAAGWPIATGVIEARAVTWWPTASTHRGHAGASRAPRRS